MFAKLRALQKYDKPKSDSRYHKQYVKGFVDYYVGITVPELRKLSKNNFNQISENELQQLIESKIHEYRLFSLIVLCDKYKKASSLEKKRIIDFYLTNLNNINNWDLVDVSAYQILGNYLYDINDYSMLYEFAKSDDLWVKRISIVATNYMIRQGEFNLTFNIVDILLNDKHDLIHKANGWMLRNIGDKKKDLLTKYIEKNYSKMPRTTLRYAIEHYPEPQRKGILRGEFLCK